MRKFLALVFAFLLAAPAGAMEMGTPKARALLAPSSLSVLPGPMRGNPPDIYLNLKTNQAFVKGQSSIFPATNYVNVSRASAATQVDSAGNWIQCASGVACRTDLGQTVWEARTNGIRNNTVQGIVAGSPGTPPTNVLIDAAPAGLTRTLSGALTSKGIDYFDLTIAGTPSGTGAYQVKVDAVNAIAASAGQTWTLSWFVSLDGGSWAGLSSADIRIIWYSDGVGTTISETASVSLTSIGNGLTRVAVSGTAPTNTAFVGSRLRLGYVAGNAINPTIGLGWPQLENNSLINSTVASAVKAADGSGGVNGSGVYSVGGGTCSTTPTLNVTWAAGVMTVNSVANAGSCTVFPPSPATLTYVSGAATGWTGATVALTPTNNAANAAASNPILTTNAAVTRAAETDTLSMSAGPWAFGTSYTTWARATPRLPTTYPVTQQWLQANNGTTTEAWLLRRNSGGGTAEVRGVAGGTAFGPGPGAVFAVNASGKMAGAYAPSNQAASYNGSAVLPSSSVLTPSGINAVYFANASGSGQPNGDFEEGAIWFAQRVPDAQLQGMTQ